MNARIETANEKPSFRNSINKRCLVIASGFYEWRWNDEKGKSKQKYLIRSADQEIFSMAGIFAEWTNPETKQEQKSYAILTTQANQTMQYIHNTKKRMPVLLNIQDEMDWLAGNLNLEDLTYPKYDTKLFAIPV